ncbi:VWA domain-containing protein [Natrialba sp. INN-245]|uniref:VWA domain-containing protein n=1 Tax=Natrialba sp. INN-245 TaxID=2690967 RepID=UPI00130FC268|nr:VWA domain-containing protein [Natrialba sp. INN-245]MWV38412.1 VWA domain-containing protein [Natrialba sp. INN-245]
MSDQADDGPTVPTDERVRFRIVEFTRALRAADVDVPATGSLEAARVLAEIGVVDRTRTRAALRGALITSPSDIRTFDRLFATFWRALIADIEDDHGADSVRPDERPEVLDLPEADPTPSADASEPDAEMDDAGSMLAFGSDSDSDDPVLDDERETVAGYSRHGESSTVSPRGALESEVDLVDPVRRLSDALARLTDRGYTSNADPTRIDVRRALRESHQTGGVVVSTPTEGPKRTASRLLFIVDVSKSVLDVIERDFLVRTLSCFQEESRSMRTFFFDTSTQEVTDAIDTRTTADAYDTLERLEATWGGGTQIGTALTEIRERHPTAVDRRTAVVVVSDGLETGDTSELEAGMNWLSRRGRIVLWWNPLATTSTYEPTCRGMETALPFVDGLFGFADEADLREIASQLERYDGTQPLGYERTATP